MNQILSIYTAFSCWISSRHRDETGASLVEYALLVALIAVVAIGGMTLLGHNVNNTLNDVANQVGGTTATTGG